MPVIATSGWSIPRTVAHLFPETGSGLSRYVAVFNGVEINSTFYRHHRMTTFERWANSVPDEFRFAVKLPREITHEHRLHAVGQIFKTFVEELAALNGKLGPLLCQLPSTLEFDGNEATAAFEAMREVFPGMLVVEPRHTSWATPPAEEVLTRYAVDRVLADPAPVWPASDFQSRQDMSVCTVRPGCIIRTTARKKSALLKNAFPPAPGACSTTRPPAPQSRTHWQCSIVASLRNNARADIFARAVKRQCLINLG